MSDLNLPTEKPDSEHSGFKYISFGFPFKHHAVCHKELD